MNVGGVWGGHSEIVSENGGDFIEVLFHIPLSKKSGIWKNWIGFCESFQIDKVIREEWDLFHLIGLRGEGLIRSVLIEVGSWFMAPILIAEEH